MVRELALQRYSTCTGTLPCLSIILLKVDNFCNFCDTLISKDLARCEIFSARVGNFWHTVKILKFGTPQTIAIIVLKIEKFDVTSH